MLCPVCFCADAPVVLQSYCSVIPQLVATHKGPKGKDFRDGAVVQFESMQMLLGP